jgi:non-heme chloroperoxidase
MGVSTKRFLRTATFVLFLSIYSQAADHPTIREGFKKTADGVSIHYLETGSNNSAQTLVLIPGWRLPAYLWKEQLQKFGATERVIAVDPRSQGQSTKTADGNTPEQRARDLHDILAQMGVSRPVLVGWSQGAQDVSAYVAQFGNDSVAGVVLVDSPVSAGPAEVDLRRPSARRFWAAVTPTRPILRNFPKEWCSRCSSSRIPNWTYRQS